MNDYKFQEAIDNSAKKLKEYKRALKIAEDEYKRRFGFYPSDIDDDDWIDSMHITGEGSTVENVKKSFDLYGKRKR